MIHNLKEVWGQRYKLDVAYIVSWVVLFIGMGVILGWIVDINLLQSINTLLLPMKVTTAFMFIVSGILCLSILRFNKLNVDLGYGLLGTVTFTLIIFSLQYFLDVVSKPSLAFNDRILFEKGDLAITKGGIPSLITSLSFFLVGMCGLVIAFNTKRMVCRLRNLSRTLLVIGGTAIIGHTLNIPILYYYFNKISTGMTWFNAILFVFISYVLRVYAEKKRIEYKL